METHTAKIADTTLTFQVQKELSIEDPYANTVMYRFKLNGTVFDGKYISEFNNTYEETLLAIVKEILNIMLSRTVMLERAL